MSVLNIRQRNARRYMAIKHAGDNEVRAAEQLRHASSSTPTLQRAGDNGAVITIALMLGLAIFGLAACGAFKPGGHPTSTLTLPDNGDHCVRGYKTRQIGSYGAQGAPVVMVTDVPCKAKP